MSRIYVSKRESDSLEFLAQIPENLDPASPLSFSARILWNLRESNKSQSLKDGLILFLLPCGFHNIQILIRIYLFLLLQEVQNDVMT